MEQIKKLIQKGNIIDALTIMREELSFRNSNPQYTDRLFMFVEKAKQASTKTEAEHAYQGFLTAWLVCEKTVERKSGLDLFTVYPETEEGLVFVNLLSS